MRGPPPNGHDIGCHNFQLPCYTMSGEAWSKYIVKNMSPINEGMGKRATWENVFSPDGIFEQVGTSNKAPVVVPIPID